MRFERSARELLQRAWAGITENLGLKLTAIVIAIILYALVHRPVEPAVPEPEGCPRPAVTGR